jgi:hypothetical protein
VESFTHLNPSILINGHYYFMFTRSELEIKTLGELKGLCKQYGLKPLGNPSYKTGWIDVLLTFAAIALRQMREGEGLRRMTFKGYQDLGQAIDQMGEPTDQQAALIRATMQGKRLEYPQRYEQETLLNLHKAKMHLEQALNLLNI